MVMSDSRPRKHGQRSYSLLAGAAIAITASLLGASCGESLGAPSEQQDSPYLSRDLSDFQSRILADSQVTPAEAESAYLGLISCLNEAGFEAFRLEIDEQGGFSFITRDPPVTEMPAFDEAMAQCEEEYTSAVELAWADATATSPVEDAAFYAQVAACLRREGLVVSDVSPGALAQVFETDPAVYDDCLDEIVAATGG